MRVSKMKEQKKLGLLERKRYERSQRRKKTRIKVGITVALLSVAVFAVCVYWKPWEHWSFGSGIETTKKDDTKGGKAAERQDIIARAKRLSSSYAYDEAIQLLQTIDGYAEDTEIQDMIADIVDTKESCVPVDIEEVTHIFYQSLVVDEERAFGDTSDPQTVGNNQWSTTVDEFHAIIQEMYDRGYVYVSIHDLYEVTEDENGDEVWEPAEILLPPDKKAVVLSLDDVNYYHSYDGYGYASKLILDDNGDVMNEYVDANGDIQIGAYDCVPILDQFVEEHPDASYKGAKGTVAVTGYNGILGYRTDVTYDLSHPNCDEQQKAWIEEHPDFDLETEREEAKKVADAMKENGWNFANHTWGHVSVGDRSLESLKTDAEKWKTNVEPLVGETNVITFAHGTDIQEPGAFSSSNEKYQFYREQGYRVFCNIDSTQYQTYMGTDYLRQGRRNIDGYRIYKNATGAQNNLSDLFDASEVLDPDRPPVPNL